MGSDINRLIESINRVGIQNLSHLSRLTGIPNETIRYILRSRFPKLGLQVGTLVDYERLGLERCFVKIRFSPTSLEHASQILHRLSKVAFLTYRSRVLLELRHIAIFAVPVILEGEFRFFLDSLVAEGIMESVDLETLEWTRHSELKSRYFDFSSRRWTIDWNRVEAQEEVPPTPVPSNEPISRPDIDSIDMFLIKELEMDSCASISDAAKRLTINERTLRWHHNKHVSPMVSSYYVRWLPVGSSEFRAAGVIFEFRELPNHRLRRIRRLFNNFPFTWYEGGRRDGYYQAHSAIPGEHLVESLSFLNDNLGKLGAEWNFFIQDLSSSRPYTIPYEHFNEKDGWYFDQKSALNSILSVKAVPKNIRTGPQ